MELGDLRIFVATVDAGSFTAAADQLMLSKQFVSRRTMALEAALGVRLLLRNTRNLAVTESGHEFYARAQRILAEVADAEQAMSVRSTELHGSLKISAPLSFGITHLSPLIAEFLAAHPAVRLNLDLTDRRVDLIGEGFDFALRIGPLEDSTLVARPLGEWRMVACCSPAYLRAHGAPASPADLVGHTCLLYGHERRVGWEFRIGGASRTFDVQGPLVANNGEVVRDAAIAGLGIARLPHFIVGDALGSGALVPVLDAYEPAPLKLNAVFPQHREGFVTLRTFIGFVAERLGQGVSSGRSGTNARA
ncbi:LysR substrate-binding domain-containing protein [Burkholderia sp. MR1-5-21]